MSDLRVLVVNIDNLGYTKDCIADLMRQIDHDFDLTVVDNGSTEVGTPQYLDALEANGVKVIRHPRHESLNGIWNQFYKDNQGAKYLCYLNNDTRLACNYISSVKEVFAKEPKVGIVCHATNNPEYAEVRELEYVKLFKKMRQGWEYTIRREAYHIIPPQLHTFAGDDFLYAKVYEKEWEAAMILSSPVIHYLGMSQKSTSSERFHKDVEEFNKLGLPTFEWSGLSLGRPHQLSQGMIKHGLMPILTINIVTYERYDDIRNAIEMYKMQTDPRFQLDIWQDGNDDKKREIVESFHDPRIHYNENMYRSNLFGHDMRDKSLMNCITPLWCTTNDDNWPSPLFVEKVLDGYESYDLIKIAVAMANLPLQPYPLTEQIIRKGVTDMARYSEFMKVLDPNVDALGQVDACSFVVRTQIAQYYGWKNVEFHGDFLVFEKFINAAKSVRRIPEVLQVHR